MDENFATNIIRALLAHEMFQSGMLCAREMFGKGYFSLGMNEKAVVDQTVQQFVAANFQVLTPAWFATPGEATGVGFLAGMSPGTATSPTQPQKEPTKGPS